MDTWVVALGAVIGVIQGGAVAALGRVMWLVYTGKLVPRATVDDLLEAYKLSEQGRAEQGSQVSEMLQLARTNNALIAAIAERGSRNR